MNNNKITLRTNKEEQQEKQEKWEREYIELRKDNETKEDMPSPKKTPAEIEKEYLDDSVWGNDRAFSKRLDKEILDERRRYVRVRYIQNIICKKIRIDYNNEPISLDEPINFTIFDISLSGIGAVCSNKIKNGTTLIFNIQFDQLTYEIEYRVVYCIDVEDKFRVGLKIAKRDKNFIKHLKIVVARMSLQGQYG